MFKTIFLLFICMTLSSCWESEPNLFTKFDAIALEKNANEYEIREKSNTIKATVKFVQNNKLNISFLDNKNKEITTTLAFIKTDSDRKYDYYIGFQEEPDDHQSTAYFVARGNERYLEIFYPGCEGLGNIRGMLKNDSTCTFTNQSSIIEAGRKVADYLRNPIILPIPVTTIRAE